MQIPFPPKGTRDFYPEDMAFTEYVFSSWHRTCRRYGFELFEAPMFEHLELYTQKSGQEIEKQLYTLTDKGGRELALRPEMTPSLARMVAAQGMSLKRPIRWYSIPRLFRYERMQRGRLREFFQLNLDILGVSEVTADAELIAASVAMMRDLGFTADDFSVLISSRKLIEEFLRANGVPPALTGEIYAILDRRHKIPTEQFDQDLAALLVDAKRTERVRSLLRAGTLDDVAAIDGTLGSYRELCELFELLGAYGISDFVRFDIGIVRGLAYYTGIVFELFDKKRTLRAIAGGGRYDALIESYGGPPTPAVGFAAGDVVLGELIREKGVMPSPPPRSAVFVAAFDDAYPGGAIALVQRFRDAGVSAEYALRSTAIARQLKQANAVRARFVVFAGGQEASEGVAKVKNMRTGDERTIALDKLVDTVREDLSSGG